MSQPTSKTIVDQLDALTGLRFIAAFAVVLHHLFGNFGLPNIQWPLGAMAVSFFFVLSGFILTYVYRDRLNKPKLGQFYFTRWARIWPLHLACLLIYVILVTGWKAMDEPGTLWTNAFLLHSWIPTSRSVFSLNAVSWSISTEMFFYLMFPVLLFGGARHFWIKYLAVWGVVIGALIYFQSMASDPERSGWVEWVHFAHMNPIMRLPEFCTGMATGFLFLSRQKARSQNVQAPKVSMTATLFELAALGAAPAYLLLYRKYTVSVQLMQAEWGGVVIESWVRFAGAVFVFAAVVYVFAQARGWFSRGLSSRLMVYLGKISFALYMIHWILIRVAMNLEWWPSEISPWIIGIALTMVSIGCSALLYEWVEVPAKAGLLRFYRSPARKKLVGGLKAGFSKIKLANWAVLLAGGCMLYTYYSPIIITESMQSVIDASPRDLKEVQFGQSMRLLGGKISMYQRKVNIELVWLKTGDVQRERFVHLCDRNGKILRQVAPESELFVQQKRRKPFVEKVSIPPILLRDVDNVRIGFFSNALDPETKKPMGCSEVLLRNQLIEDRRLVIIDSQWMARIQRQLKVFNPNKKSGSKEAVAPSKT